MKSFHNTISLKGDELNQAESTCKTQEKIINEIFNKSPQGLSASQVLSVFPSTKTPLTSIRRAMTNLCSKGVLTITANKVTGLYGRPEHIYKPANICKDCKVDCVSLNKK